MNRLDLGTRVKFIPPEGYENDYTLDGVCPGDIGVVTGNKYDDDYVISFTRQDGTVCEDFIVFPEHIEVVA